MPKIFSKNGMFSAKKGGLESPQFSLRTILVITFQISIKHSEKLSLRSSGTKNFLPLPLPRYFSFQPNSHSLGRIFVSLQASSEFESEMALA